MNDRNIRRSFTAPTALVAVLELGFVFVPERFFGELLFERGAFEVD